MTTSTTAATVTAASDVATPAGEARADGPADLAELTVRWLDALLASASIERIGSANWWPRATSALATAAATAESYPHAVSEACRKLEIDVLSLSSAELLAELEPQLVPRMREWSTCIERDAPYLVAMTRLRRSDRSTA